MTRVYTFKHSFPENLEELLNHKTIAQLSRELDIPYNITIIE